MDLDSFLRLRSFAYHTTSATNLDHLRATRVVRTAAQLLEAAGEAARVRERRTRALCVRIGTMLVHIRDQEPLVEKAIAFEKGWTIQRYVCLLNSFAFFWVGDHAGPSPRGYKHFAKYAATEELVMLRVPMRTLFDANRTSAILFSSVNSGAARPHPLLGKLPRGARTHVGADAFALAPSKVVELVIKDGAILPAATEWSRAPSGAEWNPL